MEVGENEGNALGLFNWKVQRRLRELFPQLKASVRVTARPQGLSCAQFPTKSGAQRLFKAINPLWHSPYVPRADGEEGEVSLMDQIPSPHPKLPSEALGSPPEPPQAEPRPWEPFPSPALPGLCRDPGDLGRSSQPLDLVSPAPEVSRELFHLPRGQGRARISSRWAHPPSPPRGCQKLRLLQFLPHPQGSGGSRCWPGVVPGGMWKVSELLGGFGGSQVTFSRPLSAHPPCTGSAAAPGGLWEREQRGHPREFRGGFCTFALLRVPAGLGEHLGWQSSPVPPEEGRQKKTKQDKKRIQGRAEGWRSSSSLRSPGHLQTPGSSQERIWVKPWKDTDGKGGAPGQGGCTFPAQLCPN